MVNASYFSGNSLVNLYLGDDLICWMNKGMRRSGFLPSCLDVGRCACLSLGGSLIYAVFPRIDLYLSLVTLTNDDTSHCEGSLGFLLSFSWQVA